MGKGPPADCPEDGAPVGAGQGTAPLDGAGCPVLRHAPRSGPVPAGRLAGMLQPPEPLRDRGRRLLRAGADAREPLAFEPMDEREAQWRHMGETVNAAIPPLARFEYEHDYGSPTELDLPPGWRDWKNNDRRLCLRWDRDLWGLLVDRVTNYTDLRSSSGGGT